MERELRILTVIVVFIISFVAILLCGAYLEVETISVFWIATLVSIAYVVFSSSTIYSLAGWLLSTIIFSLRDALLMETFLQFLAIVFSGALLAAIIWVVNIFISISQHS